MKNALRFSKSLLALFVGLFCLLVGIDNIIDFHTNYGLLKHVLAMDTMQPFYHGHHMYWRSITSPLLDLLAYWLIIIAETSAGICCLTAAFRMVKNIKHDAFFKKAKSIYVYGATIGLAVWYFGFSIIASEWFAMWANKQSAQATAYSVSAILLLSLIYISFDEPKDPAIVDNTTPP